VINALMNILSRADSQIIITDGNLKKIDEGIEYIIQTEKTHLDTRVFLSFHDTHILYQCDLVWTNGVPINTAKYASFQVSSFLSVRSVLSVFNSSPFKSGLTQACIDSPHTLPTVTEKVMEYLKKHIPQERVGILAGNSVHVDKTFLAEYMPEVVSWLHYRYALILIHFVKLTLTHCVRIVGM
jgi:oligoribonuclease (3'-5' exoribonuclease)